MGFLSEFEYDVPHFRLSEMRYFFGFSVDKHFSEWYNGSVTYAETIAVSCGANGMT